MHIPELLACLAPSPDIRINQQRACAAARFCSLRSLCRRRYRRLLSRQAAKQSYAAMLMRGNLLLTPSPIARLQVAQVGGFR